MSDVLRILLVDDNPDDRALISYQLKQEIPDLELQQAINATELEQALADGRFDLVITDYQIRWTNGLKVLTAVKERDPEIPVIMFTATGSEEIAVAAMKQGLDDYVLKSPRHFHRLRTSVRLALDRERQRAAVKRAESRFYTLFETVPIGLFRSTLDGTLIDVNRAAVQIFRAESAAEMKRHNTFEFYFRTEDRLRLRDLLEREGEVFDFEVWLKGVDGTTFWASMNAHAVRDEKDEFSVLEGSIMDITARKEAESRAGLLMKNLQKRIRELNCLYSISNVIFANPDLDSLLQETVHLIPSGMQYPENASARITYRGSEFRTDSFEESNTSLTAPFYCGEELVGRIEVFYPDGIYGTAKTAFLGEEQAMLDAIAQRQGGILERMQAQQTLVRMENELNRQFHLSQVGLLASGISHNLRNPLGIVMMQNSLAMAHVDRVMNQENPDPDLALETLAKMKDFFSMIDHASNQIDAIVADIMAYHRMNADIGKQAVNLNHVLKADVEMLESDLDIKHRIQVSLELHPYPIFTPVKPSDIAQMFMNLATNARDALLPVEDRRLAIRTGVDRKQGYAWFEVEDSGVGISQEVKDRLGEAFVTTKSEDEEAKKRGSGTGLGLYMIKRILNIYKGSLEVDSHPGRTRFRVNLPLVNKPAGESKDNA